MPVPNPQTELPDSRQIILTRTAEGVIAADGWEYVQGVKYRKIFDADVSRQAIMTELPDPNIAEINNFAGKDVLYIEAPDFWPMESIAAYEQALNRREFYAQSNVRYRVMPHGMKIQNVPATFPEKVVVKCAYCGQFGARGCECPKCGAPIG